MDQQSEFESILEQYPVKLEVFEGPLDLLLHLIRTSEISIADIPILEICRQYDAYLSLMQELNLEVDQGVLAERRARLDRRPRRGPSGAGAPAACTRSWR